MLSLSLSSEPQHTDGSQVHSVFIEANNAQLSPKKILLISYTLFVTAPSVTMSMSEKLRETGLGYWRNHNSQQS